MIEQYIEYNGINSNSLGLICEVIYRPILPPMQQKTISISGKSGVIDFGNNKNNITKIQVYIGFDSDDEMDLRMKAREVAKWLYSDNWGKLILWDEPDKYYLARIYNETNLDSFINLGEAILEFECQPFAYQAIDTGDDPTWDEADFPWIIEIPWNIVESYKFKATGSRTFTFYNPGTKEINFKSPQGTKSNIIISGSFASLMLSMNGRTLNYNEAVSNGIVIIDNIEMEVELNGQNKLDAISGDLATFLEVLPGLNTISVDGTGLNIDITLDFSPMWI